MYEKIVVITRKTRLKELIDRFNTRMQAKFYIERSGGEFRDYEDEDAKYDSSLKVIRKQLNQGLKIQFIDRSLLPTYTFLSSDLILVVGQDGLVANAAKYVNGQPIIGVNPDVRRNDGILVPILPEQVSQAISQVIRNTAATRLVQLAEVQLDDGQRLLAFNDLFIGAKSHTSARYRLQYQGLSEQQSSSGLIVATSAGATGWMSSVFNMVSALARFSNTRRQPLQMTVEDSSLLFVVREPFVSKHSSAAIVVGNIGPGQELVIESTMTGEGTIFSDGIESDFIAFNAGATAHVRPARQAARLVLA